MSRHLHSGNYQLGLLGAIFAHKPISGQRDIAEPCLLNNGHMS